MRASHGAGLSPPAFVCPRTSCCDAPSGPDLRVVSASWFTRVALDYNRQDVRLFLYDPEGKLDETRTGRRIHLEIMRATPPPPAPAPHPHYLVMGHPNHRRVRPDRGHPCTRLTSSGPHQLQEPGDHARRRESRPLGLPKTQSHRQAAMESGRAAGTDLSESTTMGAIAADRSRALKTVEVPEQVYDSSSAPFLPLLLSLCF